MVATAVTLAPGTALNAMIIAVYCGDRISRRQSSPCDLIFLSTALTNLSLQWFSTLKSFIHYIPSDYLGLWIHYVFMFSLFLTYFRFWATAWLSSYYCLKLVRCSCGPFIWLKSTFSSSMAQIIGISLLGIFLIILPLNWMIEPIPHHNMTDGPTRYTFNVEPSYMAVNLLLGCVFPLVGTLVCIGFSVASLLRHVWRIRKNRSQFTSSPKIKGHIQAIRVMVLQVLLNATIQVSTSVFLLSSFRPGVILEVMFGLILIINPTAQALILITGNPKLQDKLSKTVNIFRKYM
ncbi:taste receptor type 2 member 40-like [Bufo bufo]|uniref:taste receptor type 2 member 40-like n=1 Tax=Bufo bufo TaxID=8384 RepID=UPI001ABDE2D8|nr:taste receptor type 2 member 40-like [Bufo bufo]